MRIAHSHNHGNEVNARGKVGLLVALGLVLVILVVEVVGGILSNSLALLSDAAHMLVDALALGLALFAMIVAARPATPQKTYGYYRVEIMVALINGTILILTTGFILYEAYTRLVSPPEIKAPIMLVVAFIGLIANIIGMALLRKVSKASLNVKAAFWHIVGDTISSVGVIIAAGIIFLTGWQYSDGIMAVLISGIILWGAIGLIREATNVLLEAVPKNININAVVSEIKSVAGVIDVHDLHIWSITSGVNSLSAHLMIEDQKVSESEEVVKTLNKALADKYGITHTTFQIECTCSSGFVCSMKRID